MKATSPLLGFNNNVRHKGRIFHIQTEDSGIKHPHVITHLFADGGRILKTTKTSYAEHVGADAMGETVRAMMQEQHKAMFIALRDGQFDHLVDELPKAGAGSGRGANAAPTSADAAAAVAAMAPAPNHVLAPPSGGAPAAPPPADPAPTSVRRSRPDGMPTAPTEPAMTAFGRATPPLGGASSVAQVPAAAPSSPGPVSTPFAAIADDLPPPSKQSRPKLELDPGALLVPTTRNASPTAVTVASIAAQTDPVAARADVGLDQMERAANEAQTPFFTQVNELPPPPAAAIRNPDPAAVPGTSSPGAYRSVGSTGQTPVPALRNPTPARPAPSDAGTRSAPGSLGLREPSPPRGAPAPAGAGRYAPSRPAAIFATNRPNDGMSIFGEDLISEKSLDEVILSYLAEDLDSTPPAKK